MKIRTITLGIPESPTVEIIKRAGRQLERAVDHFSALGYTVQTRRVALRHWDAGLGAMPAAARRELLREIDLASIESKIDFCGLGLIREPSQIEEAATLIETSDRLCASAEAATGQRGIDRAAIAAAVNTVYHLAARTEGSFGNFRFGAGFCLGPGGAFFPGAYHAGDQPAFTIGLENSDLLVTAFTSAGSFDLARQSLFETLLAQYRPIEAAALKLAAAIGAGYGGLDTSIAPSLSPAESIVLAFQAVGVEFGGPGTLAACGLVTEVLKSLPVKQVGYNGIMLPLLEDVGLARAAEEGKYRITDLVAYSSVCGVGIDVVPLSGSPQPHLLQNLMLDVGTMAVRLNKPLLVRVLPITGKAPGDKTDFDSPYLCNSRVMPL